MLSKWGIGHGLGVLFVVVYITQYRQAVLASTLPVKADFGLKTSTSFVGQQGNRHDDHNIRRRALTSNDAGSTQDSVTERRETTPFTAPRLWAGALSILGRAVRAISGHLGLTDKSVQASPTAALWRETVQGKPGASMRILLRETMELILKDERVEDVRGRIFGGTDAAPAQLPWQTSVQFYGVIHYCGGTLLTTNIVLTAGHCLRGFHPLELAIVAGITDKSRSADTMQVRRVQRMAMHPFFNHETEQNDLGLMMTDAKFEFNDVVRGIALPKPSTKYAADDGSCVVSGWGATDPYGLRDATKLQYTNLRIVPESECARRFNALRFLSPERRQILDTKTELCAGQEKSGLFVSNACFGDSGGPLVCEEQASNKSYLAGVVSWGPEVCGSATIPVVFTDVRAFVPWIKKQSAEFDSVGVTLGS